MKSQRIAVAGGTGGIGHHVVDGLLEVKDKYSLHVIVLSRSAHPDISYAGSSVPVIAVDYNDVPALEKVLNEHRIDTVLSTLWSFNPRLFLAAQGNLLTAALNVPTVHRFSPSEYAQDSEAIADDIPFARPKIEFLERLRKVKASRDKFEYTLFHTGIFMNYIGTGNSKPDGEKALGYLAPLPFSFLVDFKNRKADVPGDGERRMVFTAAEDVGKLVAATTQLDKWEEHSDMKSDWITSNEFVALTEELVGKLDVKYTTIEEVLAQIGSSPTSMSNAHLFFFKTIIEGKYEMTRPFNVNASVGEAVKPISVKEFLQKWWGP